MPVVFIEGPDFSGKTTCAKVKGNYRNWSENQQGRVLRKFFESGKPVTRDMFDLSMDMWKEWLEIGEQSEDCIHVDRSPISTLIEQVMTDNTELEEEFFDLIVRCIEIHGRLDIDFLYVTDDVLEEREAKSSKVKDPRECMRTASERNSAYCNALRNYIDTLRERCSIEVIQTDGHVVVKAAPLTETIDDEAVTISRYFGTVMLSMNDMYKSALSVSITSPDKLIQVDTSAPEYISVGILTEALTLAKELLTAECELVGLTVPRKTSDLGVTLANGVIYSGRRKVNHDTAYNCAASYVKIFTESECVEKTLSDLITVENAVLVLAGFFTYSLINNRDQAS